MVMEIDEEKEEQQRRCNFCFFLIDGFNGWWTKDLCMEGVDGQESSA